MYVNATSSSSSLYFIPQHPPMSPSNRTNIPSRWVIKTICPLGDICKFSLCVIAWIICEMFSFNTFFTFTRTKHSTSLFTESPHAQSGFWFQSFHHGLGDHSRSSTPHLSTRHIAPCQRFTRHNGDTTTVRDIAPVTCKIMWQRTKSTSASIRTEDRI